MEKLLILILINFILTCVSGHDLNNLDISQKQTFVLKLLSHVTEYPTSEELNNITANFDLEENVDSFNKMDQVKTFITMKRKGMLTKGEVFCLFCSKHVEEAMIVFKVLYGAKDFSTFLLTSVYMRQNINELLFLYSFLVAVRHRSDCLGLVLPPIYEIYPFLFISAKTQNDISINIMTDSCHNKKETSFIDSTKVIEETEYSKLKYFTDDVGLNSFYYNFHIDYPFWMNDEVYGLSIDRRGELYIYVHRQLLARYNLERLTFGMSNVCPLNPGHVPLTQLEVPIMFHDGWTIPFKGVGLNVNKHELIKDLDHLEMQIRDAIFKGLFRTPDGSVIDIQKKEAIEAWGRRIFGNVRNANENVKHDIMYVTRRLFSDYVIKRGGEEVPSTFLQLYETAIRDPIFFELTEYFLTLINKLVERSAPYHREDLYYYGIDSVRVDVGPLITFMSDKVIDISNIFLPSTGSRNIYLKKQQLDHAPFNITISFLSNKQEESVVRTFLLPVADMFSTEIDLSEKSEYAVELDVFSHLIIQGNNTIVRESANFNNVYEARNITQYVERDIKGGNFNMTKYYSSFIGYPSNLILPRGSKYGQRFQIFVIVSPLYPKYYREVKVEQFRRKRLCRYSLCIDERALGFPFDKDWDNGGTLFPNMKLIDVLIFHK